MTPEAISALVATQVQAALVNLPGNAGASASDAGTLSPLAKSKEDLESQVQNIVKVAEDAQSVFGEAYSERYASRAFGGKMSMVFAAMVMQQKHRSNNSSSQPSRGGLWRS